MLIIRAEQMNALRDSRRQTFRKNLEQHLSAMAAIQAMGWSAERIQIEVVKAMEIAPEFHLTRESDVARLAEIFCTRLEGVSTKSVDPEGLNILYAYGAEPKAKLRRFEEYLDNRGAANGGLEDVPG